MREIFIERDESLLRIAIKDNGILSECFVEENSTQPICGEIYKGRVKNIVPSINSIFIDIGLSKETYMYLSDDIKRSKIKKGDELLVEIIKEPIGNKGAKVSKNISVAGRFVVLTLGKEGINFSKRITDSNEKKRISSFINKVDGYNITVRTEAVGVDSKDLTREIENLVKEIENLKNKLKYSTNIGKVYGENIILNKVIRENIDSKCTIIINHEEDINEVKALLDGNENITLHKFENPRGMFDYYNIEKEILKLRHKKVVLNSGGNIVIEKTEAMYVIDVNSAKNTKERSFDKTILETNLEAAIEAGRQIRLRNLSGIILIDFIDMRDSSQKPKVLDALYKSLEKDKGNIKIFPFTELDLIQIARKRRGKSIYEYIEEPCKRCNEEGYVLKLSYIEKLICNDIIKCEDENSINSFYIQLDKNYETMVRGDIFSFLTNIDCLNKEIFLNFVDGIEGFKVEPLIFNSQKENIKDFKVLPYEKYQ